MRSTLVVVTLLVGCEQGRVAPPENDLAPPAPTTRDVQDSARLSARMTVREPAPPEDPAAFTRRRLVHWYVSLPKQDRSRIDEAIAIWRSDPCLVIRSREDPKVKRADELATLLQARNQYDLASAYYEAAEHPRHCNTPLVIAFDAQPIAFSSSSTPFAFQHDHSVRTDWPTAATPWLALDRDGDGRITTGAELFGDATPLASGATATNGFAALADLDANHDGIIDARDPAFASLVLWSDRDGDHVGSADELRHASELVTSIPLAHQLDARCDDRGDCEGERGAMTWRDAAGAHTGAVVDVYLRERR